ncbi:hypothetical protein, partial [uncultured Treponema sp.]|uniref:hypothetical protein n=1 Tax=uncultured Treponema sp. TaxID=162155 RepID=UPI0025EAFD83
YMPFKKLAAYRRRWTSIYRISRERVNTFSAFFSTFFNFFCFLYLQQQPPRCSLIKKNTKALDKFLGGVQ